MTKAHTFNDGETGPRADQSLRIVSPCPPIFGGALFETFNGACTHRSRVPNILEGSVGVRMCALANAPRIAQWGSCMFSSGRRTGAPGSALSWPSRQKLSLDDHRLDSLPISNDSFSSALPQASAPTA